MRYFSGEFKGVRVLLADELDQISGGQGEDTDDVTTLEEIIVKPDPIDNNPVYYIPLNWHFGGASAATQDNPEPDDEDSIRVELNIDRPLTEEEQKALDDLNEAIIRITQAIDQIPDDAVLTMEGGRTVSGSELKQLWSKIDFEINEIGTMYPNGLPTGQADYNNGNPFVSLNIDTVKGYNELFGGINFLPLHELAHMTNAARDYYQSLYSDGAYTNEEFAQNERFANDIARAIANYGNIDVLSGSNVKYGYTPGGANLFVTPNSGGGGSGGGGGGGSGGGGY